MPRRRFGVALLLPGDAAREVDGLRRAVGDPARERIPPHLTLVPPVNVRDQDVDAALAVLRHAGATTRPLRLTIGPPATFLPHNPVLYLSVSGDLGPLHRLRDAVFTTPFSRTLTWPFVPHVTVADGIDRSRVAAAADVLDSYQREVVFEAVHVLEEGDGRTWAAVAEARFEAPAVVARGAAGLELELSVTDTVDAEGARWLARDWGDPQRPLAVTARRDGRVVGVASGWTNGELANLSELFVDAVVRGEGIGGHLAARFVSAAIERGARLCRLRTVAGSPAEGFYRSRGWQEEAVYPGATAGERIVQLIRHVS